MTDLIRRKQPGEAWETAVDTGGGGSQALGFYRGVLKQITVGVDPWSVAVTPDSASVYCANSGDATVSVIDVVSGLVTDTITVGTNPTSVAVTPDGSSVYCANDGDATISVIDVASGLVTDTITVGTSPQSVVVTPDGSSVYCANYSDATVSVIVAFSYYPLTLA